MSEHLATRLNQAYTDYLSGKLDRRGLLRRARALGLGGASLALFSQAIHAGAQEASPAASPAADYSFSSIRADDALAQMLAQFEITEAQQTGGTVVLGSSTGVATTNAMLGADTPTLPIMWLVNEGLIGVNPNTGQYQPTLADHWEISADGLTYTFFLRPGVVWHDGAPFTADDVILSFDAQSSPDTGSAYTSGFNSAVASYRKVDDLTVELVATDLFAQPVFLASTFTPMMPKHIWDSVPFAEWPTDPGSTGQDPTRVIGTGPFKFVSLDATSDAVTLARNPDHYAKAPYIDQLILSVWPDLTTAVEALRAGDIDSIVQILPASDASALQDDPSVEVAVYDTYAFAFLAYNLDPEKTTLFQDVRTRQALMYGLDRQSIVDNILLGFGEVAQGTQPVLSPAYAPDRITTHYTYDPEKAKQLLADAGWADTDGDGVLELDGQKFEFDLVYGAGDPTWDQLIAYAQEAWSDLGVAMTPDPVDFATVLLPILTGPEPSYNFEMISTSFGWTPDGDQSGMFGTDAYKTAFNFMKYSNPEVDALYEQASRTLDEPSRIDLLIEATNLVNDDIPMIIPYFMKGMTGINPRLNNCFPNATNAFYWYLSYTWISE